MFYFSATTPKLQIVYGQVRLQYPMLELAAYLAVSGPITIFDCGNQFNVYPVVKVIRTFTPDINTVLRRIRIQRAFTCYQSLTLLEGAREGSQPIIVTDLLNSFYNADIKLEDAQRLLSKVIAHLQRLSRMAAVLVTAQIPRKDFGERDVLLNMLLEAASDTYKVELLDSAFGETDVGPKYLFLPMS